MKRILSDRQFHRFIAVGLLNTVVGYGLFAGFIALGFSYPLAVLFATILGVLFNFKSIGVLVFRNPDNRLIFRFVGVYTLLYFLNVILIWWFRCLGFDDYLSGLFSLFPMGVFSFILNRFLVFGRVK